jgi:hypothetical protein
VTDPPPALNCGVFDGAWIPLWSLDELLPELSEELDPFDVEFDVEPVPVTAAWLVPGRTTATAPAASTLATDTATVVVFSRRLPCSRSATACATRRACAACAACAGLRRAA